MAGGVRSAALYDVRSVLAVVAGGVDELASVGQCVSECTPKLTNLVSGQFTRFDADVDTDALGPGLDGDRGGATTGGLIYTRVIGPRYGLIAGEFLDQRSGDRFLYPPNASDTGTTSGKDRGTRSISPVVVQIHL